ncbi:hypothetical protein COL24_23760 [Bacillus toyonensis]|uniref:hypothetical protein n=1 Tax=Bacillus cereus group TaxID=86661 RepID=UPI000BF1518A|nr:MULTISPECIES: hypothetical protein [Bacillus cereus group]PEK10527.1 hypothetical protein CN683_26645 [Bacillus toyonensis]PEO26137.1 hypothetical protein CN589_22165 [Bacillus toyonensis]PEQ07096.1 hypothetical protein CN587_02350 [Bacillus wiedmannii]PFX37492.1 hypothetical protein COL24_23760 [Bacillus toyonensis]PFY02416.1 hypothetical protein COL45_13435 [Bacillus toyonensis]
MSSMFYKIDKKQVQELLEKKLKENPDTFYYMDNYYLEKIIDTLVESIAEVIAVNYNQLVEDVPKIISDEMDNTSYFRGYK